MSVVTAGHQPIAPTAEEQLTIAEVEAFLARSPAYPIRLVNRDGEEIELPDSASRLLRDVVRLLAQDQAVALMPVHQELTTQEAADLLNVSRQYLVRLLEQGALPFTRVGTHRRIRFEDVLRYKRQRDAARRRGLKQLTRLSEELGLYEETGDGGVIDGRP